MTIAIIILLVLFGLFLILLLMPVRYTVSYHRTDWVTPVIWTLNILFFGSRSGFYLQYRSAEKFSGFFRMGPWSKPISEEEPETESEKPGKSEKKIRRSRGIKKRARRIMRFFSFEDLRKIMKLSLKLIWDWIHPNAYDIQLEIGTGDPMQSGVLFGLLSAVHLRNRTHIQLTVNYLKRGAIGKAWLTRQQNLFGLFWRCVYLILVVIFYGLRHIFRKMLPVRHKNPTLGQEMI